MQIDRIAPAVPVEIVCDGYVPLVIRCDDYKGPTSFVPKYWRTGDFTYSLVEIAVNPSSGAICKIVVTALHSLQSEALVVGPPFKKAGIPIACLSQWKDNQDRIDVEQEVIGSLLDRELTVLFGNAHPTLFEKSACGRVTFLSDQFGTLRGIQVGNLSEREVEDIRYAIGGTSA